MAETIRTLHVVVTPQHWHRVVSAVFTELGEVSSRGCTDILVAIDDAGDLVQVQHMIIVHRMGQLVNLTVTQKSLWPSGTRELSLQKEKFGFGKTN